MNYDTSRFSRKKKKTGGSGPGPNSCSCSCLILWEARSSFVWGDMNETRLCPATVGAQTLGVDLCVTSFLREWIFRIGCGSKLNRGVRRFWSMFPLTGVPFWTPGF